MPPLRKIKSDDGSNETKAAHRKERARRSTTSAIGLGESIYQEVSLGSLRGSLKLSDNHLCFQANDGSRKIKLDWDQLGQHMISASTSPNTLLKIVSKNNTAKILQLPSRESLLQIRKDIQRRRSSRMTMACDTAAPKRSSVPVVSNRPTARKLRKTKSHVVRSPKKNVSYLRSASEHNLGEQRQPDYDWAKHKSLTALPTMPETENESPNQKSQNDGENREDGPTNEVMENVSFDAEDLQSDAVSPTTVNGEQDEPAATENDTSPAADDECPTKRTSLDIDAPQLKIRKALENSLTNSLTLDDSDSNLHLSRSFGNSLSHNSFNMDEFEIERQIMKTFGGKSAFPGETEEDKAKAARKSRMSVRMSTRVTAMNQNARRASRMSTRMSTRMSFTNNRMSTRMSVSRRGSGGFVMLKDLEERDEFHKVQTAAFLRELYKLAAQQTKQHLRETILNKDVATGGAGGKDASISLAGIDLSSLSREQAKTKIDALHAGGKMDADSLISLIQAGVEMMSQEDTVIDLRELHPTLSRVIAVGDLHGSLECLMEVLRLANIDSIQEGSVIVFDGDFVDRGNNSLEVIVTLLLLKLSYPQNVILLRGNHEDTMTASSYGFRTEVDEKYGYEKSDDIWWEFGLLFAALPICARSNTAAIMHGGIPVEEFDLNDLNELSKETRCEMKTISDPYDDDERLLQGILWSDPSEEPGINCSDRGAGFTFGPDIAADFLDRHELRYIIRAHEVVETGHCHHDVGDGRGVITIFSSANYPAMEGTNYGAVLFLDDQTGEYETKDFIHKESDEKQETDMFQSFLVTFVDGHKSHLTKAFREKQNEDGYVTCEQWADVIAELLDLPEISLSWLDMQPDLAPTTEPDGDCIDWAAFLNKYSTGPTATVLSRDQLSSLSDNKDKLLDIFQLIDTSMDGKISKEEFASGMKLLNQQIEDEEKKIACADVLFDTLDVNHDGEISIEEFSKALQESMALKGVAEALKEEQVQHLKQNQEMITTAFKYLDTDKDMHIDRTEFQKGFEALNEQMPDRNKFGNHEDWFERFELNENDQIDFGAFKQLFCAI